MDEEWPKGHGEHCGGIMASRPQFISEGTCIEQPPVNSFSSDAGPRSPQDQCTMFFEVYLVHPSLKTRFAALNFIGTAKTWLHTVERRGRITDWPTLYKLVMARFDKDQYPLILKQFEATVQSASMSEFIAQFEQAAHNLLLYNSNYDETYFVT
jgi:hypothetical protein